MPAPDDAADLALLVEAAREAGDLAAWHWRTGAKSWEKSGGQGPVTEADLAVDRLLHERLRDARPDYGWMSEESPDDPARLEARRVFILDPIDGTRAFAAGERTWAVAIAVVDAGVPVAGVVHLPLPDKLYAAAAGRGATLNGATIAAGARELVDGAHVLASRPTFAEEHWRGPVPALKRHFRPSLAYRLALVAEGRFDAMLTLRASWEWDVAAGALIAAEAGATVTDRHGAPLRFNTPTRQTAGVVTAAEPLHARLLERLA